MTLRSRERNRLATLARESLADLRTLQGYLPQGVDWQVETIHDAVTRGATTWESLGTRPEEVARLAREQLRRYCPRALHSLRTCTQPLTHYRASAEAIRECVRRGAVTWEDLGIGEVDLEALVASYRTRWDAAIAMDRE